MKYLSVILLLIAAAAAQSGDDHAGCPMHAEHMAQASAHSQHDHTDALNQRGKEAMGFDQLKTTHHFFLAKNGGVIEVRANSAEDKTSIEQIQMHLLHITGAFASGDFEIPMLVHDQVPPGVPAMKRLKAKIRYRFESLENGGRISITTANGDARRAIWEFLRFQITDHKTGDPLTTP